LFFPALPKGALGEGLEFQVKAGNINPKRCFAEERKIAADATWPKVVWAQPEETCRRQVRVWIGDRLHETEQANESEQAEYGEQDLKEWGLFYFQVKSSGSSHGKVMLVSSGSDVPHTPPRQLQSASIVLLVQATAV